MSNSSEFLEDSRPLRCTCPDLATHKRRRSIADSEWFDWRFDRVRTAQQPKSVAPEFQENLKRSA